MKKLLLELKARLNKLESVRNKLLLLGAQYVGSFHQIDTYFQVCKGRLKIREIEGQVNADIIFYERSNIPKIKKSYTLLVQVQPADTAKELLAIFFPTKVVVDKIREIYILEKTRIHLDQVAYLGTFIEFEQPTLDETNEINKNKSFLSALCRKLDIKKEDLESFSYADLLLEKARKVS